MLSKEQENPAWPTIADLQKMGLKELRGKYAKLFGKESKSRSRKYLYAAIARRLQADSGRQKASLGSALTSKFEPKRKRPVRSSTKDRDKAKQPRKRQSRPLGATDPRLPKTGTTITKTYKGKKINVRVLKSGFEYSGWRWIGHLIHVEFDRSL